MIEFWATLIDAVLHFKKHSMHRISVSQNIWFKSRFIGGPPPLQILKTTFMGIEPEAFPLKGKEAQKVRRGKATSLSFFFLLSPFFFLLNPSLLRTERERIRIRKWNGNERK